MPSFIVCTEDAVILDKPKVHTPQVTKDTAYPKINLAIAHFTCFYNVLDSFLAQIEKERNSTELDAIYVKYKNAFIKDYKSFLIDNLKIQGGIAKEWLREKKIKNKTMIQSLELELEEPLDQFARRNNIAMDMLKMAIFIVYMKNEVALRAGCKQDFTWKPNEPIESLMQCIKQKGYLSIQGHYNIDYEKKGQTIALTDKLEVKPFSPLISDSKERIVDTHQVIVIGASKKEYAGEDLVYFVDELENIVNQKYNIHVIPYKDFCARAYDVNGLRNQPTAKSFLFYHPDLQPKNYSSFWSRQCKTVTQIALVATACVGSAILMARSNM